MMTTRELLTQGNPSTGTPVVEIRIAAHELCHYHAPIADMPQRFEAVSQAIEDAVVVLVSVCPPSGDRTAAIRMLLDARMVANRSISLNGAF